MGEGIREAILDGGKEFGQVNTSILVDAIKPVGVPTAKMSRHRQGVLDLFLLGKGQMLDASSARWPLRMGKVVFYFAILYP